MRLMAANFFGQFRLFLRLLSEATPFGLVPIFLGLAPTWILGEVSQFVRTFLARRRLSLDSAANFPGSMTAVSSLAGTFS